MYLENLNWQQAGKVLKTENQVIVVPLGSTEQHGPIGPLGTDFIIPNHFASIIDKRTDVLITPTMPFGVATHHTSFPGTIDIGTEGLYLVMKGITDNLMKHGGRKFLFLNGHGGNTGTLERVSLEIFRAGGLASIIDWWALAPELNPEWKGGHGDGQEVSMIMAIDDTLINKESLVPTKPNHISEEMQSVYINQVLFKGAHVKVVRDIASTVNHGGFGGSDSYAGTKQWGEDMCEGVVNYTVDFIDAFRKIDLAKSHARA